MDANVLDRVREIINNSNNIVFFGGAGVSTASGIPDFRSATGLYNREKNSNYSPEYMLSHEFFENHPDEFIKYAKNNLISLEARPNDAHYALKTLEDMGKLRGIITQNIDGLHQMAGSKVVNEIHGNLRDYYCTKCFKNYDLDFVLNTEEPPICTKCGGIIRPDIVLYGEALDVNNMSQAIKWIEEADVFIVGGTSLVVYPAAGLLDYYRGDKLILMNMEETPLDYKADYTIYGDIATNLDKLVSSL